MFFASCNSCISYVGGFMEEMISPTALFNIFAMAGIFAGVLIAWALSH